MADYHIFFFIILPVAIIIMLGVMYLAIKQDNYDQTGPQIRDTFDEMKEGDE
jgi:uncharacterized alpha/beta hydrolase family protein